MTKKLLPGLLIALVYLPVLTVQVTVSPDSLIATYFFQSLSGFEDYFQQLIQFNALDFQPVRDLSLALDFYFYKNFQLNIGLFQNVCLWFGICLIVKSLVQEVLDKTGDEALWLTCLFAVYPLFSATVSYHFGRKHLLSFLFLLLATKCLIRRRFFIMNLVFLLSLLSQPIYCLWPVWATYKNKSEFRKIIPAYVFSFLVMVLNYFYYKNSTVFSSIYSSKFLGIFDFGEKIRALGHYVFDLFFPYQLSYEYDFFTPHVFIGLGLWLIFLLAGHFLSEDRKQFWLWTFFAGLSFAIPLFNTKVVSDTYLLAAGFGLFMSSLVIFGNRLSRGKWLLPVLLIIWGGVTFYEARLWTRPNLFFYERNFTRVPNCSTAFKAANQSINDEGLIHPHVRSYVYDHFCLQQKFELFGAQEEYLLFLKFSFLYLDPEAPPEDKIKIFEKYAQYSHYSRMLLILTLRKVGRSDEAIKQIDVLKKVLPQAPMPIYNYIVDKELRPYCDNLKDPHCVKLLLPFTQRQKRPFFN